jgi:hypothetical protein
MFSQLEKHATSCGIELCISFASHLGISDHVSQRDIHIQDKQINAF